MINKTLAIKNKLGIHARPAAMLARTAGKFSSKISIIKNGQEVDCKSILGIMMLAVEYNAAIMISANGSDENEALSEIEILINNKFQEE